MATYNDNSCVASLGNTGLANCVDNLGADARLLYTLDSFEFATYAASILESNYEDAINAGTMSPFPQFQVIEPTSEDDVIEETTLGEKLFVREGKYSSTGSFELAMCNLAKLRTFNEVLGRVFIVTVDGQIFGTSPDGIKFRGFKLSEFHMSGINGTDGTTKRKVDLRYQLKNPNEMNDYPAIPTLTWDPLELAGIIDAVV
ncbi:hypothetical protein KA005_52965, partial [bacterium]|nr:hypothetical protein [bacterium]